MKNWIPGWLWLKKLKNMASKGIEPATFALLAWRSYQLQLKLLGLDASRFMCLWILCFSDISFVLDDLTFSQTSVMGSATSFENILLLYEV